MRVLGMLCAIVAAFGMGPLRAQDYPARPVRVVVPFTPGSGTDIFARLATQKLSELWRQQVVVENRTGAGGTIGAAAVAKSAGDGYTLLWTSNAFVSNPALQKDLPYDPLKDFAPIAPAVTQPFALAVGSSSTLRSLAELVAAGKARPAVLSYASAGIGSATHFAAEKFKQAAGIDALHVPYKGGPEANGDVIAGRVTYWFAPVVMAAASAREGKVAVLGVTSSQRSALLPAVPTLSESGLRGCEYALWNGMWAPAATPAALVERIAADIARVVATADLRERLAKLGAEPLTMTPAQFARFIQAEMDDAAKLARFAGLKPE